MASSRLVVGVYVKDSWGWIATKPHEADDKWKNESETMVLGYG